MSYAEPIDKVVSPTARGLFSKEAWDAATIIGNSTFCPHRLMWQAMIYNRVEVPNPPVMRNELERFAREHPGKLALKGARYEGAICDVMPFVCTVGARMRARFGWIDPCARFSASTGPI